MCTCSSVLNRNQRHTVSMLSVLRNCSYISYQYQHWRYILISTFIFPRMIAFKLVVLLRLARFHYKNCKNTDFEFSSFLQTYFSLWLILSSAYNSYYIFLYMTTAKINFEKSKYLRNTIDALVYVTFLSMGCTFNVFTEFLLGWRSQILVWDGRRWSQLTDFISHVLRAKLGKEEVNKWYNRHA